MDGLLWSALDIVALGRLLETRVIGRGDRLFYLPAVDSTSTLAMQLAHDRSRERSDEGLVVLTDSQTAGKGRQGRRWVDAPGRNVLVSIVLRPLFPPHLLVMVAALAVVGAIAETCGVMATLKWPNDVLIEERKVAGILIETSHDASGGLVAVTGIGINANGHMDELAAQLAESASLVAHATSLEDACGHAVSREELIARLLRAMEGDYLLLQQEATGASAAAQGQVLPSRLLRERWRDQLSTLGRTIQVRQGETLISGVAEDVDDDGELLLRRHSGELVNITWGSVEYPGR
jgi:BirA family transcriptional regulator, biotin operon repressor / biotin---[acetyl-CoA-carboxylase] ligase